MPNTYLLSPTSDPFNPFQSILDTPQDALNPARSPYIDVRRNSLSSSHSVALRITSSLSESDIRTSQAWSTRFLSRRRSDVDWSVVHQTGLGTNSPHEYRSSEHTKASSSSLRSLSLTGTRCGDNNTSCLSWRRIVDEEESRTIPATTIADIVRSEPPVDKERPSKVIGSTYKKDDSNRDNGAARKTGATNNTTKSHHFKTEYCVKFRDLGQCPFGEKCQFVHYEHELRPRRRALTYKTQRCWSGQGCRYQQNHSRCNFLHDGETADMFNKQRGIRYAKVIDILDKKRKRQQRSVEKDAWGEIIDIQQHEELPTCLESTFDMDFSSSLNTTGCDPRFAFGIQSSSLRSPLRSVESRTPTPDAQDSLYPQDHSCRWRYPVFEEQDTESKRRSPNILGLKIQICATKPQPNHQSMFAVMAEEQSRQLDVDGDYPLFDNLSPDSPSPDSTRTRSGVTGLQSFIIPRERYTGFGQSLVYSMSQAERSAGYYRLW
ncbi:hypothetical protein B0O80DRAFT_425504 [Mortierella sp. GBAus27b]|nr:hypothetical protein B0O80DRAFT_425504 [Mortierella sp. GBAus27b]